MIQLKGFFKEKNYFVLLLIAEKNGNGSRQKMNKSKAPVQRAKQNRKKGKPEDLCPEGAPLPRVLEELHMRMSGRRRLCPWESLTEAPCPGRLRPALLPGHALSWCSHAGLLTYTDYLGCLCRHSCLSESWDLYFTPD